MIKYPDIPKDEVSDWWRAKQKGGFEPFHVPLPTIADHKEDIARVKKSRPKMAAAYVSVCNEKINVQIEHLPEPTIRLRGDKKE